MRKASKVVTGTKYPEYKEQFLEEIQEKRIAMPNRKHLAEEAERKETLEESVGQEEIE